MSDSTEPRVEDLIALATREPTLALEEASRVVGGLSEDQHAERAVVARAMALATRLTEGPEASIHFADMSLSHAERSGDSDLIAAALMTLSGSQALSGRNDEALASLGRARRLAQGLLSAEVDFQEAAVRTRLGQPEEARRLFSTALPKFVEAGDEESIAMTLHNRGRIHLYAGEVPAAISDFTQARDIEERLGMAPAVAGINHNLGLAWAMAGDFPKALSALDSAESAHEESAGTSLDMQVTRVEVLLMAGLFEEARGLAASLSKELLSSGLREDGAEATLAEAHARFLIGDTDGAMDAAERAAEMFKAQKRGAWFHSSQQVILASRLDVGAVSQRDVEAARDLAGALADEGHIEASRDALLTAGLIAWHLDMAEEALESLVLLIQDEGSSLARRMDHSLAETVVLILQGDLTAAEARARVGMADLDEAQALVGAADVRSGLERHGKRLGSLGLHISALLDDPVLLFEWAEMTRARSLLARPVLPSADEQLANALSEVRQLEFSMRSAAGEERSALAARRQLAESTVVTRSRYERGAGGRVEDANALEILSSKGTLLVELVDVDGTLTAITSHGDGLRHWEVGSFPDLVREADRHRFSATMLARGRTDSDSFKQSSELLDKQFFHWLPETSGSVVLVPPPELYAIPWSALPTLADASLSVAPSAAVWERAARVNLESAWWEPFGAFLGPDLEEGVGEVSDVRALYGNSQSPSVSRTQDLLESLPVVGAAHVAAHAAYSADNPLFSYLRLGDGNLHVYDMQRLPVVPKLVVLSACDSGFSPSRNGEELLGLTASLLSMGARAVVASVGLVPDTNATRQLMVGLHEGIVSGSTPATALRKAQDSVQATSGGMAAAANFICIGAG